MEEPRSRVAAVANSTSLWLKEPVVTKSGIVGVVGALLSIAVIGGYVTEEEKVQLVDSIGTIVPAAIFICTVVAGIWSRFSVNSPKTTAQAALVNVDKAYQAGLESAPKPDPVIVPTEAEVLTVV